MPIVKNIAWRTPDGSSYDVEQISFEINPEDIIRIKKALTFAKENPFVSCVDVLIKTNVIYLDENGEETEEFRVDTDYFRVSDIGINYRAQNKWDSSDVIESDYIAMEELEPKLNLKTK